MQRRTLPVDATIDGAYRDMMVVLRRMPGTVVLVLAAVAILFFARDALLGFPAGGPSEAPPVPAWRAWLLPLGFGLAASILTAPMQIAIYRMILLGERPASLASILSGPRFASYYAILALIAMLSSLGGVLALGSIWFGVRIWMIFPSIATDGPVSRVRPALASTTGNFWRVVCVSFFLFLPSIVLFIGSGVLFRVWLDIPAADTLVQTVALGLIWILSATGGAHAYRALVEPADDAPPPQADTVAGPSFAPP